MGLFQTQTRTAVFSPNRRFRYQLTTIWDTTKPVLIGLFCNPSIADERREDNTDRLFRARARKLDYGGTVLINLFAIVSTDPKCITRETDPIGKDNDHHIIEVCKAHRDVFCGWGINGAHYNRGEKVLALIRKHNGDTNRLYYLKLTKDGYPSHPLYIRNDTSLTVWNV